MRTHAIAVTITVAVGLAGVGATTAQDLFPTPEGRLGGREPLPSPEAVLPTPVPPTPAVTSAATAAATEAAASPTSVVATSVPIDPAAIEAGAFSQVRSGTVTVLAWRGAEPLLGSGWVYDEGRMVTAAALVEGADRVEVVAADGRLEDADLLGVDPLSGVALLGANDLGLPPLAGGETLEAGRAAVAVGTAEGAFPGTLVSGLVSSAHRSLLALYPTTSLILATMTLPDGMAGGPLVDETTGAVVGMVVPGPSSTVSGLGVPPIDVPPAIDPLPAIGAGGATALPSGEPGLAFAVPLATVERVVSDLAAQGRVDYPFLGAALEPVTAVEASRLGLPTVAGAVVREVVEDGPAETAGVEPGDVIVAFAGEPIGSERSLPGALAEREPGETVAVELLRDGDRLAVDVTLGERPEQG